MLSLVIMPTFILNRLDNNRLRFSAATKIQETCSCCWEFEGSRAPILHRDGQWDDEASCSQERQANVRNIILPFQHGSHFSVSWRPGPGDCEISDQV